MKDMIDNSLRLHPRLPPYIIQIYIDMIIDMTVNG